MRHGWVLIGVAGLGAGLMYLLDPERGRALIRGKATHCMQLTSVARRPRLPSRPTRIGKETNE